MIERIEPIYLPGLPPLNRHTYIDDQGNPLPNVRYSYRRGVRAMRHWVVVLISMVAAGMMTLLALAAR